MREDNRPTIARMLDRFSRSEPALAQEIIRIRAGVLHRTSFDRLARDVAPRLPRPCNEWW
jgi:hypothetical protein